MTMPQLARRTAPPDAFAPVEDVGSDLPLVVDVDGALVRSPLLHEAVLRLASDQPRSVPHMLLWAFKGARRLEAEVNDRLGPLDDVPLHPRAEAEIRAAVAAGRRVLLASAADRRQVEALARRLGAAGVLDTSGHGTAVEAAADALGPGRFDALVRFEGAASVRRGARTLLFVRDDGDDTGAPSPTRTRALAVVRALRTHQWAKNALVFLPVVLGHALSASTLAAAGLAFLCFSLAASSAYALNDLLDLKCDRASPTKRRRPFASGALPVGQGALMAAGLLATAVTVAAIALPAAFLGHLAVYMAATVAYSTVLKRKVFVDVVTLAGLYALRVLGGGAATGVAVSDWLLMLCLFLFLSLAVAKRYAELSAREREGRAPPAGRGYRFEDMRLLLPLAAASGYLSVLVVALYLNADQVEMLYAHPDVLRITYVVQLYWVSRVLFLANRGELNEDPVLFALRDRISWLCGGVILLLMLLAL
ncbi:UbiA family prenyltransferase [Chthonobacter rhizosphaerae]|uniref:UbiA family prenyltransferase n=1 Tax=Chthonobacter rhizosphaerae TaxID=2735553 RepID=UPI0015EFC669|nr:UbiA family prenyltransferase [Chthonobacter rhizosphaerae]